MSIAWLRSDKNLSFVSFLVFLGGSCTPHDAHPSKDYIGPRASEPNAVTANSSRKANLRTAVKQPQPDTGPLRITTEQATLLALENNRSLVVERLNPQISQTFVPEGLSIFDPVLTGQAGYGWSNIKEEPGPQTFNRSGPTVGVGVQEFLPTGTSLGVTGSTSLTRPGRRSGQRRQLCDDDGLQCDPVAAAGLRDRREPGLREPGEDRRGDIPVRAAGFRADSHGPGRGDVLGLRHGGAEDRNLQSVPGPGAKAVGGDAGTHPAWATWRRPSSRRPRRRSRCAART